jgi:hypothetical protein
MALSASLSSTLPPHGQDGVADADEGKLRIGYGALKMVRPAGIEPATYGLEGRCSIQLSYGRILEQQMTRKGVRREG